MSMGICSIADCEREATRRGWCQLHYQRWMRNGHTDLLPRPSLEERFWAKVIKSEGCWTWTGGMRDGYGFFNVPPTTISAHRMSYQLTHGSLPEGLFIDHQCRNPGCVNPAHLKAVTPAENNQNHSGPMRNNKSGVRGVHWDATNKKWVAQACLNRRTYSGGYHDTLEAATEAVLALRLRLHSNNLLDKEAAPNG